MQRRILGESIHHGLPPAAIPLANTLPLLRLSTHARVSPHQCPNHCKIRKADSIAQDIVVLLHFTLVQPFRDEVEGTLGSRPLILSCDILELLTHHRLASPAEELFAARIQNVAHGADDDIEDRALDAPPRRLERSMEDESFLRQQNRRVGVSVVEVFDDGVRISDCRVCGRVVDDRQSVVGAAVPALVYGLDAQLLVEGFDIWILDPFRLVLYSFDSECESAQEVRDVCLGSVVRTQVCYYNMYLALHVLGDHALQVVLLLGIS